ncbi:MAG: transposase [Actinomycetota bacterium]|nr:transposase [Actinomycetota bacterium]
MGDTDPAPLDRPRRRTFPADYKLKFLADYDACAGDGDKGALLRREGLYSSHVVEWRKARDAGALAGLGSKARPPKVTPEQAELARARKRAERAESELAKARLVIEIQGKASELLGRLLAESTEEQKQQP